MKRYKFAVLPAPKMLKMFYYVCLAMFPVILLFLEQYCYVKVSRYDIDNGISQLSIISFPY